jgi:exodeoxyribonuclease V beta subunit
LTAARLAEVFQRHAAPPDEADYAARLSALGFAPLSGFLKGYIDLVFRHRGRYYLVDYKTNWLGERVDDYAQPALRGAMRQHDYYLQYHLYTLALHRYLRLRVAGYDYARDFAGVCYLFVRGMAPEHAPGHGVFRVRPAPELIADLDALMDDAGAT